MILRFLVIMIGLFGTCPILASSALDPLCLPGMELSSDQNAASIMGRFESMLAEHGEDIFDSSLRFLGRIFLESKIETSIYDPKLNDSDYILRVGLREIKRLKSLSLEESAKKPIAFFRSEIPRVLGILRSIKSEADHLPYFLIDENGHKKPGGVSVGEVKKYLLKQGEERYANKSATLDWFPEFVIEVMGLRCAVFESISPIDADEYKIREADRLSLKNDPTVLVFEGLDPQENFYLNLVEAKRELISQRNKGTVHWPVFSSLKVKDFKKWENNLKPIGLTEDLYSDFDRVRTSSFDRAIHDIINHILPEEFLPYAEDFKPFKKYVFNQFKSDSAIRQELFSYIWFEATHDGKGALYIIFAGFKSGRLFSSEAVSNFSNSMSFITRSERPDELPTFIMNLRNDRSHGAEITTTLWSMSADDQLKETNVVWSKFLKAVQEGLDKQVSSE